MMLFAKAGRRIGEEIDRICMSDNIRNNSIFKTKICKKCSKSTKI